MNPSIIQNNSYGRFPKLIEYSANKNVYRYNYYQDYDKDFKDIFEEDYELDKSRIERQYLKIQVV